MATCCGAPVVKTGGQCMGNQTSCSFTITQSLCIEIPISFGAVIETGTPTVQYCLLKQKDILELPDSYGRRCKSGVFYCKDDNEEKR